MILPPGSILQRMHFLRRIKKLTPGFFIEIGPGNGVLSQSLLELMWHGICFEIDKCTSRNLKKKMAKYLKKGQYKIKNTDFLQEEEIKSADLILASMVIEHLESKKEAEFFKKTKALLKKSGTLFCYVPGSPAHWGIEDEIAGHFRRYTAESIKKKLITFGMRPINIEGLTYPLSNILLPISNWLVKKYESDKLEKSDEQKTRLSGRRVVPLKTEFPAYLRIFLNSCALYPFFCLQNIFKKHPQSLTIFFEARSAQQKLE